MVWLTHKNFKTAMTPRFNYVKANKHAEETSEKVQRNQTEVFSFENTTVIE